MDILMEISTEHVSDLKISPRSARKLLREVQKSKQGEVNGIQKQKDQPKKEPKKQLDGGSLLDGEYDEEQSHQYFLEALMEFRGQQKSESIKKYKKSVQFNMEEDNIQQMNTTLKKGILKQEEEHISSRKIKERDQVEKMKSSFLFGCGGAWSNENYPSNEDGNTQTEKIPIQVDKKSCWNCYKLIYKAVIESNNRIFCSQKCLNNAKKEENVRINEQQVFIQKHYCRTSSCNKLIEDESKAYYNFGQLFCDKKCFEQFEFEETYFKESISSRNRTVEFDLTYESSQQQQVMSLDQLEQFYHKKKELTDQNQRK